MRPPPPTASRPPRANPPLRRYELLTLPRIFALQHPLAVNGSENRDLSPPSDSSPIVTAKEPYHSSKYAGRSKPHHALSLPAFLAQPLSPYLGNASAPTRA